MSDGGPAADVRVGSDASELMDGAESTDGGPLFYGDMSCKSGRIGHNDVIADKAIVSDVDIGHDEAVAADLSKLSTFHGAAMNRDVFADLVVVADLEACWFTFVGEVLRADADCGEGEDAIVAADFGGTLKNDVRDEFTVLAHLDIGSDNAEGSDGARLWYVRRGIDDGGGMYAHIARRLGLKSRHGLFAGLRRGAVDELAGDSGFAGELAIDECATLHLNGGLPPNDDVDFDAELVAGHDGLAELGAFDAGEDHELGFAIGDLGEQKSTASLGDGFNDENTGHDGVSRKVSVEVGLVGGDVLEGDDALAAFDLDNAVNEQERIAMWQDALDLDDVERGSSGGSGFGCRIGNISHESLVGRGNYSSQHSAFGIQL